MVRDNILNDGMSVGAIVEEVSVVVVKMELEK
jgi:hypothetical protein